MFILAFAIVFAYVRFALLVRSLDFGCFCLCFACDCLILALLVFLLFPLCLLFCLLVCTFCFRLLSVFFVFVFACVCSYRTPYFGDI